MWNINDQTSVWGERKGRKKKSQLSCHFLYICHAKQYLGMSGHYFHFVVTDMAKVRNVWVMVIDLQRARLLTGSSFRKMLGNMKEVFIFLWFKMLNVYGKKWEQANAHLLELLNGELTHMTPTSHTRKFWNNNTAP